MGASRCSEVLAGALLVTALLASGCAPGAGSDPVVVGDGELVIGGAPDAGDSFVDLTPGAEVQLVAGSQGGFHVWLGHEIRDVRGELDLVRTARRVEDGALVLRALPQRLEVPDTAMDGWWRVPDAVASFMCPSPVGIQVYDREIELHSQLVDEDGNVVAEGSVTIVPRCPEDALELCHQICSG